MTIDERIERLTERHEALAQSVELLTHNIDRTNAEILQLTRVSKIMSDLLVSHDQRIRNLEH